ncbi:MAG: chondroitinase [Bacteroides sp.]|uniref:chondroitinase family polysaccharide lyase n=1 Tax=Bacteroides sp. TaxID=29523 RepID=UPI001B4FAF51|nr:chondroitinase family polysaccharide lyase [Bacteroides sp.]MBP9585317.1 chondroitinase [Bacteroides sp.]
MTRLFFLCLYLLVSSAVFPQFIGFEDRIPESFTGNSGSKLALSSLYYKEGTQSLEWSYKPGATLEVSIEPLRLDKKKEASHGITLWIYNEKSQNDSIRVAFLDKEGEVSYGFAYQLKATGWRACWISFEHMQGGKQSKEIVAYRLIAPKQKGRIFIDRLTFPMKEMNLRTTPDQQMPYNNALSFRDLWHWCRVWQWEQYTYELPLTAQLSEEQRQQLCLIEKRVSEAVDVKKAPKEQVDAAYKLFQTAQISRSGLGFTGAPLVAPDELDRTKGEISWNDLETMLSGFAYDATYNHSIQAQKNYFTVFDYAIDQGFAFGSGMGTNHHYGYQVRKIYTTAWLMRKAIYGRPNRDAILSALCFWAALQETRKPYQYGRDELLDSWHTLLMAKTISALLMPDERERDRALKGLSRWVSTSLNYTPGTLGGIKVDGTTFHHGGFYPAYTTGVFAVLGQFIAFTSGTEYEVSVSGRQALKSAFLAMRNYCNLYEWGIGISGRHPFGGSMNKDDVAAFASLALAGDLSANGDSFDHGLAADYLRLLSDHKTPQSAYFKEQGILPAKAPQGFFVYNYGSAGIFRRANWMVTLKGYNTDVWGAEIYAKDNRYGRYQSYGSVQIFGKGHPVSRDASGFVAQGWDWNRLPGTTTIHLPLALLDSPLRGTTMAKSKENFSGSSALNGANGVFAMKLMERELKNFTSDFVARKSVFCFDNRMICLGSGISNSNTVYPTETTLFQCAYRGGEKPATGRYWLTDGYDNYYHVVEGTVRTQVAEQQSLHEKTRAQTSGVFASAWIDHGQAPKGSSYEYMVLIQPDASQLKRVEEERGYRVLRRDDTAHVVFDETTRITAYAAFEAYQPQGDELLQSLPAEVLVMHQPDKDYIRFSVCDPNLNILEKEYTTKEPSRPIEKTIVLKGGWKVVMPQEQIRVVRRAQQTELTVRLQHGQPIECLLQAF